MVKNAIKKIKKAKTEVLEKSTEDKKSEPRINLKQDLVRENAYISDILGLVNFPKRDDSDDDETGSVKKIMPKKGGAKSVQELRNRLKAKLDSLQENKGDGKKSARKKLSKEEKKAKQKEEKRLQAKLSKMKAAKSTPASNGISKAKPVYTTDGKMVFSKFDFTSANGTTAKKSKDPKLALQNIEKQKEKMRKLEEKGETETVKTLEKESTWSKALDKTEGVKVKDDVGLLKKSIKRKEQKKKSSVKKWDARKESEESRKNAKQQKRQENLQKRKSEKKSGKMKKLAKKGRVPGFR